MTKFLPLVWKNLGRNKTRSVLTGAAIALAIALVCVLRTMPAGLDAMLDQIAKNNRISIHNKAGIVYSLPYSYLQKVRSVPGVVSATSWTWFGGSFEAEKGVTFPNFAVDPETVGVVYEDLGIAPEALADFQDWPIALERSFSSPTRTPLCSSHRLGSGCKRKGDPVLRANRICSG